MRPNFVFLMADQFRGDALGVAGNGVVETPNLDYLASRGSWFSRAYTPCPSCIPARAMVWTGMKQWHAGILSMAGEQPEMASDYPHTLAGELTKAGYQTQLVGKAHFSPQRALMGFEGTAVDESGRVESAGFEDDYRAWFRRHAPDGVTPDDHGVDFNSWVARPWHLEEWLHPTAWTMTRAIEFLKGRDKSRPFFLNVSFDRPHSPYVPPRAHWEVYDRRELPAPVVGEWAGIHAGCAVDPNALSGELSAERVRRAKVGYYGEISFVDAQVGRLMTWLRRYAPEVRENTYFVFCSDHGDMQGDHHLWRKGQPYEGSARVPLIVAGPEGGGRKVVEEVVALYDIMPTVLELAGLERPRTVEGESLVGLMKGGARWREYVHGEHGHMQYVTDGKRKFVWFPYEGREQFFDLEEDAGERRDLIGTAERAGEIAVWRERLVRELAGRDCGWVKEGRLFWPGGKLVSPWARERWRG